MTDVIRIHPTVEMADLERYVREKILPGAQERDRREIFARKIYEDLHRMGWMQSFIPQELGGTGMGVGDLIHITRRLAYGSSGVGTTFIANMLGMGPAILYGSPELRRELAEEALRGLTLWSFGMTEPDTGTDLVNTRTTATPVEGGYRLNGTKCFITNGNHARHFTIFAQVKGAAQGKHSVTAFHVPADAPGFTRGEPLKKLGQRESNTTELFLKDVFVPKTHRLGGEGEGLKVASHCLQRSKTLIGAAGIGMCDRAFDIAKEHLSQRVLYGGKPLLTLPTIQNQLADLYTRVQAAWLLVCQAAAAWDSGTAPGFGVLEASMGKVFAADITTSVTSEILELFGGYGFCAEFEIERLYRDVKILEIFEGATLVQNILIAKEIFRDVKPVAIRKAA